MNHEKSLFVFFFLFFFFFVFFSDLLRLCKAPSAKRLSEKCRKHSCFILVSLPYTVNLRYNDPPPSPHPHLFPKTLPLKWIGCCIEYLMSRLMCKNGRVVLFLFP